MLRFSHFSNTTHAHATLAGPVRVTLKGRLPSSPSLFLPSVYMGNVILAKRTKIWPSWCQTCSVCPDVSLVPAGRPARDQNSQSVYIGISWLASRVTLSSNRMTPNPGSPCPSQANFASSYRDAVIYKALSPWVARYAGNPWPGTKDNFSSCQQALVMSI